jgi:nicotinamidase/pyrazinamidase
MGQALLLVDVQNDFCPGGSLAVPEGDRVVPVINRLAERFAKVVATQDWHPPGHVSFASSHLGAAPFQAAELPGAGRQMLWPEHCLAGSPGAELHPGLQTAPISLILRKGTRVELDSYSAFFENDHETPTGLAGYLRERGFGRVFLAGLAFDFCVRYSAEDAMQGGFGVVVITDACRAIDVDGSAEAARSSLQALGVASVAARDVGRRA